MPYEYSTSENVRLGIWVKTQRKSYKQGRLSEERVRKLDRLGFVWDKDEANWEANFQELNRYKKVRRDEEQSDELKSHVYEY